MYREINRSIGDHMTPNYTKNIKNYMQDYTQDIHTALPGRIIRFDADLCEATVKPYGKYRKADENTPNKEKIDYPEIHGVPVFFPQSIGQKVTIVYPVKPDDECLLIYNEKSLETW